MKLLDLEKALFENANRYPIETETGRKEFIRVMLEIVARVDDEALRNLFADRVVEHITFLRNHQERIH